MVSCLDIKVTVTHYATQHNPKEKRKTPLQSTQQATTFNANALTCKQDSAVLVLPHELPAAAVVPAVVAWGKSKAAGPGPCLAVALYRV